MLFFWFFCFFSKNVFWFSLSAFEFFLNNNNNTHVRYIHRAIVEKKRRREEFLSLFLFLLFSLWKRGACAFLVSVVALFRSIDDDEEF